jgi:hypothetical protein
MIPLLLNFLTVFFILAGLVSFAAKQNQPHTGEACDETKPDQFQN